MNSCIHIYTTLYPSTAISHSLSTHTIPISISNAVNSLFSILKTRSSRKSCPNVSSSPRAGCSQLAHEHPPSWWTAVCGLQKLDMCKDVGFQDRGPFAGIAVFNLVWISIFFVLGVLFLRVREKKYLIAWIVGRGLYLTAGETAWFGNHLSNDADSFGCVALAACMVRLLLYFLMQYEIKKNGMDIPPTGL